MSMLLMSVLIMSMLLLSVLIMSMLLLSVLIMSMLLLSVLIMSMLLLSVLIMSMFLLSVLIMSMLLSVLIMSIDCSAEEAVRNGGSGVFARTPTGQTVGCSNATGRKLSNFKAETSALQNAVAYIAEMKPQKTVMLTDSKAALQSLISNTPDKPIHQLLKDLQLLPHECTVVLQWIPAHCGIPGNERTDRQAKSGSKNLQPMSTSTYQEAKTLLQTDKNVNGKEPLETAIPLLTQSTIWQDMSKPLCSGCERTGHCGLRVHLKRTGFMDCALCDCKEAQQTALNILQDCPIWR